MSNTSPAFKLANTVAANLTAAGIKFARKDNWDVNEGYLVAIWPEYGLDELLSLQAATYDTGKIGIDPYKLGDVKGAWHDWYDSATIVFGND